MKTTLTIALSHHRPEIIPLSIAKMRRHAAIILEDPPDEQFGPMLAGDLPMEEYVLGIDTEYPEFSLGMCRALRLLFHEGKAILQVEPYLEKLLQIHERFGEGMNPNELRPERSLWAVYQAERDATGALISFYEAAAEGDFDATIERVMQFAKLDAKRFRLRDQMRAEAISAIAGRYPSAYIEAGQMHVGLAQAIRRRVDGRFSVASDYLMMEVMRSLNLPGRLFAPGDILTLLYYFSPETTRPRERLLAARALVQNKLVAKAEMATDHYSFPHARDELETIHLVEKLDLPGCRCLLPLIGKVSTQRARLLVTAALEGKTILP